VRIHTLMNTIQHTMNILFSNEEKKTLKNYEYTVENDSITSIYLDNFWKKLQSYIPIYISPNIVSILGFVCTFCAFLSCYYLHDLYPTTAEILTLVFILAYANLDSIDGIHARETNNASPLGEFIDHALDSFSTILLIYSGCKIFGITEQHNIWAAIKCAQLNFLMYHLNAYINGTIHFSRFLGPTEILFYGCILGIFKILGFNHINYFFKNAQGALIIVLCMYTYYILKIIKLQVAQKSFITFWILTIGILMSSISTQHNIPNMLLDCLPFAMITCDIILCKMAQKRISLLVLLVFIVSKYNLYLSTLLIGCYFGMVLYEISNHLNIPILRMRIQVE
jgi:phosphatidylglycerophosphate synthase